MRSVRNALALLALIAVAYGATLVPFVLLFGWLWGVPVGIGASLLFTVMALIEISPAVTERARRRQQRVRRVKRWLPAITPLTPAQVAAAREAVLGLCRCCGAKGHDVYACWVLTPEERARLAQRHGVVLSDPPA